MKLAPLSEMPDSVKTSPETVRESYQFAQANPEILKNIPVIAGAVLWDIHPITVVISSQPIILE